MMSVMWYVKEGRRPEDGGQEEGDGDTLQVKDWIEVGSSSVDQNPYHLTTLSHLWS